MSYLCIGFAFSIFLYFIDDITSHRALFRFEYSVIKIKCTYACEKVNVFHEQCSTILVSYIEDIRARIITMSLTIEIHFCTRILINFFTRDDSDEANDKLYVFYSGINFPPACGCELWFVSKYNAIPKDATWCLSLKGAYCVYFVA